MKKTGAFGANTVPEILKPIEVLGIIQARKWQVASLNEFRAFFNLKKHKTFEDINPDPYVANTLRKLYDHPDMVEMYPGMFLEDTKPRMDPGMGLCMGSDIRLLKLTYLLNDRRSIYRYPCCLFRRRYVGP